MGIAQLVLSFVSLLFHALRRLIRISHRHEVRLAVHCNGADARILRRSAGIAPNFYPQLRNKHDLPSYQVHKPVPRLMLAKRTTTAITQMPARGEQYHRPVRALRLFAAPDAQGRIAIGGTMAEVCAELERMVAKETVLS